MADKLPNCMGYIDGSAIVLDEAPIDDPESYFTRKQRYAIQLQAICDQNKIIRNLFVGFPGSVHDARVFTYSEIGKRPENFLSEGQWIAGDSAYKNTKFMVTPFRNNATTGTARQRKQFNKYHSSFRVKIECCFGEMKETFCSLKGLRVRVDRTIGHKLACDWITVCVILYNIVKDSIDEYVHVLDEDEEDTEEISTRSSDEIKRLEIFNFVTAKLNCLN